MGIKFDIQAMALDGLCTKLDLFSGHSQEIIEKALYEGAGIITDKVRANLEQTLGIYSTGELAESLGVAPMRRGKGTANVSIGFDGYDSKGTPNALKARAMESGTSKQPKRPFMRPALNATKGLAQSKMLQILKEEIEKKL